MSTTTPHHAAGDELATTYVPPSITGGTVKPRQQRTPKAAPSKDAKTTTVSISADLHARLLAESERRLFGIGRLAEVAISTWLDKYESEPVVR